MISGNVLIPMLVAFAVTAISGPFLIPFLRRLKIGQVVRKEGVQAHLAKSGTPTMGGIMILLGILIASLIYLPSHPQIGPMLILIFGFGLIGFLDDYLKVVRKNTDGLSPAKKMLGQFLVTTLFLICLRMMKPDCFAMLIPFSKGKVLSGTLVQILAVPLAYFAIIGTVNGVNFTDGLDGLASSVTFVVALFFTVASVVREGGIEPAAAAAAGALLGFLLFNVHPAMVFMGDTGSLALGGFVAGAAYSMQLLWFIPIVGLIYFVEVLSVILQVTYFKKTGGKRIFKMAPIHHHFELCGWSETRVVTVFSIITLFLCLIGLNGIS